MSDPRRYPQQNFAERLFPGPSRQMTDKTRAEIQKLIEQRSGQRKKQDAAPAEDSKLQATLDQHTELLKAILASSVDSQTDARSTAQNSRTFAWAGTAIAILTLVATVISIIAVIQH